MIFCVYMCILMGKRLAVFFTSFFFTSKFFELEMKNRPFLRKNGFASRFYKIDV